MAIPATAGQQPYSIKDAWAYVFSAGVPGSGVDLPGIIQVAGDPQNTENEHRGDDTVLAKVATRDSIDLTLTLAIWDFTGIVATAGGTVSSSGTTPNQIRKIIHKATDAPPDVAIKVQTSSVSADGGGTRLIYPRCQSLNMPPYGMNDQEFNDLDIPLSAIANSSGDMVQVEQYETYTALTSTF